MIWDLCQPLDLEYRKIVNTQIEFVLEEETQNSRFWDTNGSSNLGQKTRPNFNLQERNLSTWELRYSFDHRVKEK